MLGKEHVERFLKRLKKAKKVFTYAKFTVHDGCYVEISKEAAKRAVHNLLNDPRRFNRDSEFLLWEQDGDLYLN